MRRASLINREPEGPIGVDGSPDLLSLTGQATRIGGDSTPLDHRQLTNHAVSASLAKISDVLPLVFGAFAEAFGKQSDGKSVRAQPFALGALG
jgi:hypothetical protein